MEEFFGKIDKYIKVKFDNPRSIVETLTPYLTNKLFCEHRSNNLIGNLFHSTTTINKINKVITACNLQIEDEKNQSFSDRYY